MRERVTSWPETDYEHVLAIVGGGPSLTVIRGKTHYAASLMSAADQQIPDDTRVVLEELITETGR